MTAVGVFLSAVALTALLGADASAPKTTQPVPAIRLDETKGEVVVSGLDREMLGALAALAPDAKQWAEVFRLYVDQGKKQGADQLAMLGALRIDNGTLRFTPRFPLVRGVSYRAVFNAGALSANGKQPSLETMLSLPTPMRKPTTMVTRVYPTADRLPENQLKFYLHFSAPMSQGRSYRHITLRNATGKAVDLPFLELDQELWDATGKRLTVFLDPGRVKRGLKPREEAGPVLEEGKRYTLAIDAAWPDAEGTPLKEGFRKSFSVTVPDDTPPDPKTWKLTAPRAGAAPPLRVVFPKSMDHALLERLVGVVDASGKKVAGKIAVTERETVWLFTPDAPWHEGAYHLVADRWLEDLAGNSIGRPFEVDVLRPVERSVKTETVKRAFQVSK